VYHVVHYNSKEFAVKDLNGDGYLDNVATNIKENTLSILLGKACDSKNRPPGLIDRVYKIISDTLCSLMEVLLQCSLRERRSAFNLSYMIR
jgi:hypothetical protein